MPVLAYGINHKTTPLDIREQLAITPNLTSSILQQLSHEQAVNEAVILSTCNRTEIYTTVENQTGIEQWLNHSHAQQIDLNNYLYQYNGIEAVKHIMRVASGLDSMVMGEPQILGQMKQAYSVAQDAGCVGKQMQQLFPAIFAACKMVRSKTTIGHSAVSFAYATMQLAKQIFSQPAKCQVLLIGAGETIELVAAHLHNMGITKIIVANRTVDKAKLLADQYQAQAVRIGDIPSLLSDTDIVVTATASQLPIVGKGMVESALKLKKRRPIFMVDLAMPRDIEPEVNELEDIYLYNIDDLQNVINQNLQNRQEAARQAEAIIDMQADHYMRQLRVLGASDVIRHYRQQIETTRETELQKALTQLRKGGDPEQVISSLSRQLTNKIMHKPTIRLREAAYDERLDVLLAAKELFCEH